MKKNYPIAKVSNGANKVSVTTSSALVPKGTTFGTNTSWNYLNTLATFQESEVSPDVITGVL